MNRILRLITVLFKSRIIWFVIGMVWLPAFEYTVNYTRQPTAFEAMGWVSHYHETKNFYNFIPDFGYSLRFPGDRDKFESFVKRMNLQEHKISEDQYGYDSNGGGRRVRFNPDNKGFEIEFTAYQT